QGARDAARGPLLRRPAAQEHRARAFQSGLRGAVGRRGEARRRLGQRRGRDGDGAHCRDHRSGDRALDPRRAGSGAGDLGRRRPQPAARRAARRPGRPATTRAVRATVLRWGSEGGAGVRVPRVSHHPREGRQPARGHRRARPAGAGPHHPGVTSAPSLARLVFPALRWRRGSFAHERAKIDAALAAGVGGFIIFGGTREAITALTRELRQQAGRPLLIGADLERGPAQQAQGLTELPPPAALGWLDDLDATGACGVISAAEARAVGITWVFACPEWDPSGRAASFSSEILGYLRATLYFGGLVVTDALIMAGSSSAQPVPAATVGAVAAGYDALLYPEDFSRVAAALDRAVGGELSAARADDALAHYDAVVSQWGDLSYGAYRADQGEPDLAAHAAFADGIADRAAHLVRGDAPRIRTPLAVSIVDDDVGGPYSVGPRDVFHATLRDAAVQVGKGETGKGTRVVLVYSE